MGYRDQGAGSLALLIMSWLQLDLQEQRFSWKSAIYIMERRSPSLLITQLQKQVLEIKPLGHPTTATATGTDSRNTSTLSLATPGIFLLGNIFKEGTRPNYIFRSEPHRIVLPFFCFPADTCEGGRCTFRVTWLSRFKASLWWSKTHRCAGTPTTRPQRGVRGVSASPIIAPGGKTGERPVTTVKPPPHSCRLLINC